MSVRDRVRQRRFPSVVAEAAVSLLVAADRVEGALSEVYERHGLTGDQYNVLRILRGAHPAGHPRNEIAHRMIHRAPDVTRMLDRLVGRKLVTRVRDPDDGRLSVARITPAGLALLDRVDPELERVQSAVVGTLSKTELRQLSRLCDKLVK